jgi:hypothetical protein
MNAFVPCHSATSKSASKSSVSVYHGMCSHPMLAFRRAMSACGARETNASDVSRAPRCAGWATLSAIIEQPTHARSGHPRTPGSKNAR